MASLSSFQLALLSFQVEEINHETDNIEWKQKFKFVKYSNINSMFFSK